MLKRRRFQIETTYFLYAGPSNTESTLTLAVQHAQRTKILNIIVASTTGKTALKLSKLICGEMHLVCITHHSGFREPGSQELSPSIEKKLNALGVPVLRATHLFAGIDRALRLKFSGIGPAEIVAHTYRTLGEGFKVAVEIAVMALDAGLIPYGKDIISIGGTGSGADTAIVIRPAHSHHFFDTKIKQIICKPV